MSSNTRFAIPCGLALSVVLGIVACGNRDTNTVPVAPATNGNSVSTQAVQLNQVNPESNGAIKAGPDDMVSSYTKKMNATSSKTPAQKAVNQAAAQSISQIETLTDDSTATQLTLNTYLNQSQKPVTLKGALVTGAATTLQGSDDNSNYQVMYNCKDKTPVTGASGASTIPSTSSVTPTTGSINGDCESAIVDMTITPKAGAGASATPPEVMALVRHTPLSVTILDAPKGTPSAGYTALQQLLTRPPDADFSPLGGVAFAWMDSSEVIYGSTFLRISLVLDQGHGVFQSVGMVANGISAIPVTAQTTGQPVTPGGSLSNQNLTPSIYDAELARRFPEKSYSSDIQKQLFSISPPVISSINRGTDYVLTITTAPGEVMNLKLSRRFKNAPRPLIPRRPPGRTHRLDEIGVGPEDVLDPANDQGGTGSAFPTAQPQMAPTADVNQP